jgi:hypothetical protein
VVAVPGSRIRSRSRPIPGAGTIAGPGAIAGTAVAVLVPGGGCWCWSLVVAWAVGGGVFARGRSERERTSGVYGCLGGGRVVRA